MVAVAGVQRGEAQVSGLGVLDRRGHVLPVADLADEDAVRRLAQGVLQSHLHVQIVGPDLALIRKLPTPCKVYAVFSSSVPSYSFFCLSSITSWRRARTVLVSIACWLMGMATPLILILMGDPTDRKMSEAFLSAISWNSRFIADMASPLRRGQSLLAAQQIVDAGLRAGLGVDLLDDHRTV